MDLFKAASDAVSRVWDFENRKLRPDATSELFAQANEAVSKLDDEFSRDMLQQALDSAKAEFDASSTSLTSSSATEQDGFYDAPAMQAIGKIFDFKERRLKDGVNEDQLNEAIHFVDNMDKSDPEYDFAVVALGMAEREFHALDNQEEKFKHEFDGIDSISLKDLNKKIADEGFDDSEMEFAEPETDVKEEVEIESEEEYDEDFEFFEEDEEDLKKEEKKKAQKEKAKKSKEASERSRKQQEEYYKRKQEEDYRRQQQEQIERDNERVRQEQEYKIPVQEQEYKIPVQEQEYKIPGEQEYKIPDEGRQSQLDASAQPFDESRTTDEHQSYEQRDDYQDRGFYNTEQKLSGNQNVPSHYSQSDYDVQDGRSSEPSSFEKRFRTNTDDYVTQEQESRYHSDYSNNGYGQNEFDPNKEAWIQAQEQEEQARYERRADEISHMRSDVNKRYEEIRAWENQKHGENLHAVNIEKSQPERFNAQGENSYGHQGDYSPNSNPADYTSGVTDVRRPDSAGIAGGAAGAGLNAAHEPEQSAGRQERGNSFESRFGGSKEADDYSSSYTGYHYGNSQDTDSYFEHQKRQTIEDSYQAQRQEQLDANKERVSQLRDEFREKRESAERFAEERHSSMRHRDEGVETHQTTINTTDDYTRQRTPHHYQSDNYRPHGNVIGTGSEMTGSSSGRSGHDRPGKPLNINPANLTNKSESYGSSYSSYAKRVTKNAGGQYYGNVIGRGTDVSNGESYVLNKPGYGALGVVGSIAEAGRATIGVASEKAKSMMERVQQNAQANKQKYEANPASQVIEKELKPAVGMNIKRSSGLSDADDRIIKQVSQARVGMMYAHSTKTKFISAIKEPSARLGKSVTELVLMRDAYEQTDIGQGVRKLRHGATYVKGAASAAFLAGSILQLGGTGMTNLGRGADRIFNGGMLESGSASVKKGSAFVPVRRKAINARWSTAQSRYSGIINEFSVVKKKHGKEIKVLDRKALNAEINAMRAQLNAGAKMNKKALSKLTAMEEIASVNKAKLWSDKFSKAKRNVANVGGLLTMAASNSDSLSMQGIGLAVKSGRYLKAGISVNMKMMSVLGNTRAGKFVRRTAKSGAMAAGRGAAGAGKLAGRGVVGGAKLAGKGSGMLTAQIAGMDYNSFRHAKKQYIDGIKNKLKGKGGDVLNSKVATSIRKTGKRFGDGAKKGVDAVGKGLGTLKGGAKKVNDAAKKVGNVAGKAFSVVTKPVQAAGKVLSDIFGVIGHIKRIVLIGVAIFAVIYMMLVLAGTALLGSTMMFMTDTTNLQRYIDYCIDISKDWYNGNLDSRLHIGTKHQSLNDVYELGDNKTGKYRIITTRYLDENGREIDSNDNIKEILAMVAVKTFNNWPDNWEQIDFPFDGPDYTVNKVQKMIKGLYKLSHTWEAQEKGPYIYYKEVNNQKVRLLADSTYPGSGTILKTLKGDAADEACKGPRKFYCNEDTSRIPEYTSEYRREMDASYGPRGGCKVDYYGWGTYDAAEDTITLAGSLTSNGKKVIKNAHAQVWATEDMKNRYEQSQMNGGEGDESRIKHASTHGEPNPFCQDYSVTYAHTEHTVDTPPAGCNSYDVKTPDNTAVMNLPYSFPSTVTFTWQYVDAAGREVYAYTAMDGVTHWLPELFDSYPSNSITLYRRNLANWNVPSGNALYVPQGTEFTCKHSTYTCNEIEYYCSGHRELVKIFYCDGQHQEWYCDKNHYDLDVNIHISHFDEIFQDEVDFNNYRYRFDRKAVAVDEYPEGFDKIKEKASDDFYWDKENKEQARTLANGNWNELYDGVEGADDVDVEMDDDTITKYREYIDVAHIAKWDHGVPKDSNGNTIAISGYSEWFYDDTRNKYVKVKREVEMSPDGLTSNTTWKIEETSTTSPVKMSAQRKQVIDIALKAVGKIPYVEGGQPGTGKTLSSFGWVDDEHTAITDGLDSGGFVAWVYQRAGQNLTNTDSIKKIWDKTTSLGTRKTVQDKDLLPGDLGFINSYDDRDGEIDGIEVENDMEVLFNTVGIYLGTNEQGQKVWIQCSKANGVVSVTTSAAFNYYRRVPGI